MPTCTCALPIGSRSSRRSFRRVRGDRRLAPRAGTPLPLRTRNARRATGRARGRAADRLAAAGWTASARGDVSAGVSLRSRALALMPTGAANRPQVLADLARLCSGEAGSKKPIMRSPKRSSSRKGPGTSECACELDSPSCDFGSRSIRPPTTSTWKRKHSTRRPSARRMAMTSGLLAPGASCTGLAGVSAIWNVCARQRSALSSTTGVRATRTTRSWTWSECSSRWCGAHQRLRCQRRAGDPRTDAGHRGAEAFAMCFLGQARGMLGQRRRPAR